MQHPDIIKLVETRAQENDSNWLIRAKALLQSDWYWADTRLQDRPGMRLISTCPGGDHLSQMRDFFDGEFIESGFSFWRLEDITREPDLR